MHPAKAARAGLVYKAVAQLLHTPHVHFKALTEGNGLALGDKNRPDEVQQAFPRPLKFKASSYLASRVAPVLGRKRRERADLPIDLYPKI